MTVVFGHDQSLNINKSLNNSMICRMWIYRCDENFMVSFFFFFLFAEISVIGRSYLDILQQWLMPQIQKDSFLFPYTTFVHTWIQKYLSTESDMLKKETDVPWHVRQGHPFWSNVWLLSMGIDKGSHVCIVFTTR